MRGEKSAVAVASTPDRFTLLDKGRYGRSWRSLRQREGRPEQRRGEPVHHHGALGHFSLSTLCSILFAFIVNFIGGPN
jgi:hypothetical protein